MSDEYMEDPWPTMADGTDYDGKELFTLTRRGENPFKDAWDVEQLIQLVEENLHSQVMDIPIVSTGANNYGIHMKMSDRPDVIVRLARDDVNMPGFDGFPHHVQVAEVKFEAAVYELLHNEPEILASRLLFHWVPVLRSGPKLKRPDDIMGRRLFAFERAEGRVFKTGDWNALDSEEQVGLLIHAAQIRAALFSFAVPPEFATLWLRERLFEQKPESIPIAVAPTPDFCVALFTSKIEATIRNIGDMIGWESDGNTVGPRAAAAKQSLLRFIPYMLPKGGDQADLYRLVLEHGDYGIHNMTIKTDSATKPRITSLFDWETGCIVPALLSDPLVGVSVDLVVDEDANPAVTRLDGEEDVEHLTKCQKWAEQYFNTLFDKAPSYKAVIQAGKDARRLWFALRDWRGDDPEDFFGELGDWSEKRMQELGV